MADTISLYRDHYGGPEKNFILAHINLDNYTAGTHYHLDDSGTVVLPGSSQTEAKWLRVSMAWWDGHNLSNISNLTPHDDSNRVIGIWSMVSGERPGYASARNFMGCNEGWEQVPIGVKPDDWDDEWRTKYYTLSSISGGSLGPSSQVFYMSHVNSTWDSNTQYYYTSDYLKRPTNIYVSKKSKLAWSFCNWFSTATSQTGYQNVGIRPFTIFGNATSGGLSKILWNMPDITGASLATGTNWNKLHDILYTVEYYNAMDWSVPNHYAQMIEVIYQGKTYYGTVEIDYKRNGQINYENPGWCNITVLEDVAWGDISETPENYKGPISEPGGGAGTYNDTDDGVIVEGINGTLFTGSVSGGFKVYDINSTILNQTIHYIFDGTFPSTESISNLTTGITDCYALAIPATSAGDVDITILGNQMKEADKTTTLSAPIIASGQEFVDCGIINLPRYYDNFLDFAPYTTISVSMPFIGKHQIPVNEVMYGGISLKYRQDNYTGDLIAFVEGINQFGDRHIIAAFSGNGKYGIPITSSVKNNNALTGLLSAAGTFLGYTAKGATAGAQFGGAEGAAAGAILGGVVGTIAATPSFDKMQSFPETGQAISSLSGCQGYLGYLTPYIEITRSIYRPPASFGRDKGYPSNITSRLRDVHGFAKFRNLNCENIPGATEEEKAEILVLLSKGVYIYPISPDEN